MSKSNCRASAPAPRANASRCLDLARAAPEFRPLLVAQCPFCQGRGEACVVAQLRGHADEHGGDAKDDDDDFDPGATDDGLSN